MTSTTLSLEEALDHLKKQSEKAKRLLRGSRSSITWIQALSWRNITLEILTQIFGKDNRNTHLFTQAKNFIPRNSSYPGYFFLEGLNNLLSGFIEQIEMGIVPMEERNGLENNRKILIISGQNENLKEEICDFIRSLNLEPVILKTDTQEGKTTIDVFEEYSATCSFALVLITGDNIGSAPVERPVQSKFGARKESELARLQVKKERMELKKHRERENELFKLGYFIGRMGRLKVRVLSEEIFQRPSDIDSVLYVPLDERWKDRLIREMQESGILINEYPV